MLVLSAVTLSLFTCRVDAAGGIYSVQRQDFASSQPPVLYQKLVSSQPGVYQVHRQEFTGGNTPFAQNDRPPIYGYLNPRPRGHYSYTYALSPPRQVPLFVPANEAADTQQLGSLDVLASEYNRRLQRVPARPRWLGTSTTPAPVSTMAPATAPYSPPGEAGGVLPAIPIDDEGGAPLPSIVHKGTGRQDAGRQTGVQYHSFNDFVEISDEQRELLESFGSNDESRVPEVSPIRRRRSEGQVFGVLAVCESGSDGRRDPEQLVDAYAKRLWEQIKLLGDAKKSLHRHPQSTESDAGHRKAPAPTIVAADDSTVIVFNGDENFGGKLEASNTSVEDPSKIPSKAIEDTLEGASRAPVPLQAARKEDLLSSEDRLLAKVDSTRSTQTKAVGQTEGENWSDEHEQLRDGSTVADAYTTKPSDQIIYLPEEKLEYVTHQSDEFWNSD